MPAATKPQAGAGASFAICADLPLTFDKAGYEDLDFTVVGNVTNIGEFLRNYNLIAINSLEKRQTTNVKGSYTEGAPPLGMNYVPGDPGQVIMLTALNDDDEYSFRIKLRDGTSFYSTGLVTGFPITIGGVDELVAGTANLTFNSQVLPVFPT